MPVARPRFSSSRFMYSTLSPGLMRWSNRLDASGRSRSATKPSDVGVTVQVMAKADAGVAERPNKQRPRKRREACVSSICSFVWRSSAHRRLQPAAIDTTDAFRMLRSEPLAVCTSERPGWVSSRARQPGNPSRREPDGDAARQIISDAMRRAALHARSVESHVVCVSTALREKSPAFATTTLDARHPAPCDPCSRGSHVVLECG